MDERDHKAMNEELRKEDDVICPVCGGYGYTIEIEAECCGNYKEYECCGIPNPVQVQVQCKCDNGYVRSEHCL